MRIILGNWTCWFCGVENGETGSSRCGFCCHGPR